MSDIGTTIGRNLRRLRTGRGLSLAALAAASGVAKATLTNLEAGRGNPTIDTLYALADSLSAPLGELLAPEPTDTVTVVRADEGVQVPGSAVAARLLDRLSGRSQVEIFEITCSRVRREADPHPPDVLEALIVTAGRLLVGPADAPEELAAGDFIHFRGDRPHVYAGVDGEARAIVIMSYP